MYNGLAYMSTETPADVLRVAISVEEAGFAHFQKQTSTAYKDKMRSLFQNLKNKSNPGLRKRILSGEVTPHQFIVMSHEELKSAERREEEQRMHKENLDNARIPQEELNISGSLTCGKCHKKTVSYTQAQTRSADEPMTTFCKCTACGHRWKFS
jgi:transcription elongation factor S-II